MTGVADGITFDVGDIHYGEALTCFCNGDLCNSEHWCDTCSTSGQSRPAAYVAFVIWAFVIFNL